MERLYTSGYSYGTIHFILFILFFNIYIYKLFTDDISFPPHSLLPIKHSNFFQVPRSGSTRFSHLNPFQMGISYGELFLLLVGLSLTIFWSQYWRYNFSYLSYMATAGLTNNYGLEEVTARVAGHMSNLFSSLLILPASRTNLWVQVFGVPFERALNLHKILGVVVYFAVTVHMCTWLDKWNKEGTLWYNMTSISLLKVSPARVSTHNWTVPACLFVWLCTTLSLITAILFRRVHYHVFQRFHRWMGMLYFLVAVWHAWSFW